MALSDMQVPANTMLLACIIDQINLLIWFQTKDAQKGRNKPKPIMSTLREKDNTSFETAEEFEEALASFRRKGDI